MGHSTNHTVVAVALSMRFSKVFHRCGFGGGWLSRMFCNGGRACAPSLPSHLANTSGKSFTAPWRMANFRPGNSRSVMFVIFMAHIGNTSDIF